MLNEDLFKRVMEVRDSINEGIDPESDKFPEDKKIEQLTEGTELATTIFDLGIEKGWFNADLNRDERTRSLAIEDLEDSLPTEKLQALLNAIEQDDNESCFNLMEEGDISAQWGYLLPHTSESKLIEQGGEDEKPEDIPPSSEPEEIKEPEDKPEAPKEVKPQEPEAPEITKEYIGNTEDDHYYLVSNEDEDGNVEDLQIVDQEGVEKFSAKANGLDPTNVPEFLFLGINDLRIESIEFSIFEQYLFPFVFEEEDEEEKEEETPEGLENLEEPEEKKPEEPVESKVNELVSGNPMKELVDTLQRRVQHQVRVISPDTLAIATGHTYSVLVKVLGYDKPAQVESKIKESKKHLIEMKITDHENNEFEVNLVDDDTMDTVIDINGKEFRFDPEFAAYWKDEEGNLSEEGLQQLALDALANMDEDDYNELVTKSSEQEEQSGEEFHPAVNKGIENESKLDEKDMQYAFNLARTMRAKGKTDEEIRDVMELAGLSEDEIATVFDVIESKTVEARMGVDYMKSVKAAMKAAKDALKTKDYEAAAKALEDVEDDAHDAAKAAMKMKREDDRKAEADKKKKSEPENESKLTEDGDITEEQMLEYLKDALDKATVDQVTKLHAEFTEIEPDEVEVYKDQLYDLAQEDYDVLKWMYDYFQGEEPYPGSWAPTESKVNEEALDDEYPNYIQVAHSLEKDEQFITLVKDGIADPENEEKEGAIFDYVQKRWGSKLDNDPQAIDMAAQEAVTGLNLEDPYYHDSVYGKHANESKVEETSPEPEEEECPHCGYKGEMDEIEDTDDSGNVGVFPNCPECGQRTSDIAHYWKESKDKELTNTLLNLLGPNTSEKVDKDESIWTSEDERLSQGL